MTLLSLKCVSNLKSIFYLNPQWRRSQRYTRFHENGSFSVHSSSTPQWRRSQRYTWFHENGSFTLHSSSNPQNKTSCSLQTENLASALLTLKAFLFTKIAYFFNQFFGFFDPTMTLLTPQLWISEHRNYESLNTATMNLLTLQLWISLAQLLPWVKVEI